VTASTRPGIAPEDNARRAVAPELARILAESYTLYLKTHNFHWNVTGPLFPSLHALFETQYTDLAAAVDEIAERIRALGEYAPGSYREFAELSSIEEASGRPDAASMVSDLARDNETIAASLRAAIEVAEEAGDTASADLMTGRLVVHDKNAWMLRSSL